MDLSTYPKINTYRSNQMMMKIICCFVTFFWISILGIQAQEPNPVEVYTSPKGVFVRLGQSYLTNQRIGEKEFVVKRRLLTDSRARSIGTMKVVPGFEEFQATLGIREVREFQDMLGLTSSNQTMQYLESNPEYKEVAILAELKIEFLQAMGFAFLDRTASRDEFYEYTVYEITADGEKSIGAQRVFHQAKNFYLSRIKVEPLQKTASDSTLFFQWRVQYGDNQALVAEQNQAADALLAALGNRSDANSVLRNDEYQRAKAVYKTHQRALSVYPVSPMLSYFNVYYRLNDETRWRFLERRNSSLDSLGSYQLTARIPGKQDDVVETFVIPQDFVYNVGDSSQIEHGVIAHNGSVELIYGVSARDTTNAIILQWAKLANKPYYTGIEIARSSANQPMQVLQVLPTQATTFTDYDVFPAGTLFTYYVRPLFIPLQGIEQDIPAQVAMSCAKFSRPTPPFNVVAQPENTFARLSWEVADEKAGHSYIIYRGTSPSTMLPIRSAVQELTYLDTTGYLSPRFTYYYSVMAMNVTQDTSALAPYATYIPVKKEIVQAPASIGHDMINGDVVLNWPDVKLNDDFISGYVVQRRIPNKTSYQNISQGILRSNLFRDSTALEGIGYEYRIGTLVASGDTSSYSPDVAIDVPKAPEESYGISDIVLVNVTDGIQIKWPSVESQSIESYQIYRKLPTETTFQRVGSVRGGNFDFIDKSVKPGVIYTYTVRSLQSERGESDIVQKKSILREVPKS